MKIVITGNEGFVGKNLSSYLSDMGEEVERISLRNSHWKSSLNRNCDVLIHLAGKAHDISNTSSHQEYMAINRDLTIDLFLEFINSDINDFFYFSSVKAVADTVDSVLDESVVGNPMTSYGKSKFEAEKYLLSKAIPKGKRLFIIRPCMIHGPDNKGNLNLLFKFVEKGIPWPLAAFDNQRSFLSIHNLSFLVNEMIKSHDLPSGIYNFSDDEVLSTNDLVKLISQVLGTKPKLWSVPMRLIKICAKIGDKLCLPLNSQNLKKLTESYVVSNSKIKKALGLEKLPMNSREGMVITIESFVN